jgi:hypothetical protein
MGMVLFLPKNGSDEGSMIKDGSVDTVPKNGSDGRFDDEGCFCSESDGWKC